MNGEGMKPLVRPRILARRNAPAAHTARNVQTISRPCSSSFPPDSSSKHSLRNLKMFTWSDMELMRNSIPSRKRKMDGESRFFSTRKFQSDFAFNNELIFWYLFTTRLLTPDRRDEYSAYYGQPVEIIEINRPDSEDITIVHEVDAQTVKSNAVARIVDELLQESIRYRQANPVMDQAKNSMETMEISQQTPFQHPIMKENPCNVNRESLASRLNGRQAKPVISEIHHSNAKDPKEYSDEMLIPQQPHRINRPRVDEDIVPSRITSQSGESLSSRGNGLQTMPETESAVIQNDQPSISNNPMKIPKNPTGYLNQLKFSRQPVKRPRMEEDVVPSSMITAPHGDSFACQFNENPIVPETAYTNQRSYTISNNLKNPNPNEMRPVKCPRLTEDTVPSKVSRGLRGDSFAFRVNGQTRTIIPDEQLLNAKRNSNGIQPLHGDTTQMIAVDTNIAPSKSSENVRPLEQSNVVSIPKSDANGHKETVNALPQAPPDELVALNSLQTKKTVSKTDDSDFIPMNTIGYLKPRKPYQAERMRVRLNKIKLHEEKSDTLEQIVRDVGISSSDAKENIEKELDPQQIVPQEQSDTLEQIVRDVGILPTDVNENIEIEEHDPLAQIVQETGIYKSDANDNIEKEREQLQFAHLDQNAHTKFAKDASGDVLSKQPLEDEQSRVMKIINKVREEHNELESQRKRHMESCLQDAAPSSYVSVEEQPRSRQPPQAERMRVRLIPSNAGAAQPKDRNEALKSRPHPKIRIVSRIPSTYGKEKVYPILQPIKRQADANIPNKVDTRSNNQQNPNMASLAKHPNYIFKQQMKLGTDPVIVKTDIKTGISSAGAKSVNQSQQIKPMAYRSGQFAETSNQPRKPPKPQKATVRLLPPAKAPKKLSFLNNAFNNKTTVRLLPPAPELSFLNNNYQEEMLLDEFRERVDKWIWSSETKAARSRKQALLDRFEQLLKTDSELALELKATIEMQIEKTEQRRIEEDQENEEQKMMWQRAKEMQKYRARLGQSMLRDQETSRWMQDDVELEQIDTQDDWSMDEDSWEGDAYSRGATNLKQREPIAIVKQPMTLKTEKRPMKEGKSAMKGNALMHKVMNPNDISLHNLS